MAVREMGIFWFLLKFNFWNTLQCQVRTKRSLAFPSAFTHDTSSFLGCNSSSYVGAQSSKRGGQPCPSDLRRWMLEAAMAGVSYSMCVPRPAQAQCLRHMFLYHLSFRTVTLLPPLCGSQRQQTQKGSDPRLSRSILALGELISA